jgi:hypothetical protein
MIFFFMDLSLTYHLINFSYPMIFALVIIIYLLTKDNMVILSLVTFLSAYYLKECNRIKTHNQRYPEIHYWGIVNWGN